MFDYWFFWAVAGVACIGLEMLIPGFVIFFFGVGALVTALCSLIPFVHDTVWLQMLLFVLFSSLSIVFLRKKFKETFYGSVFEKKDTATDEYGVGETCEVVEPVSQVVSGRIRFRGTTWTAVLAKSVPDSGEIKAGESALVCGRDGLTYIISPLDSKKLAGKTEI